jgi:RNA polymerase sigma-70 factor (ECF subfamily)
MRTPQAPASGFRSDTKLDDSPEAQRQTRLAVARARTGDAEAVRFLYIRYSNNVYGYVRSILRNDHDAEDVTQHVFGKLMTALARYDERGIPFFAWLLRLARNAAIDHLRANRTVPCEMAIDTATPADTDRMPLYAIRDALRTLPDDQREVVVLRHLAGLTPGEIAERIGRSEASVHGLHHRGRRSLQEELLRSRSGPSTRNAGRTNESPAVRGIAA